MKRAERKGEKRERERENEKDGKKIERIISISLFRGTFVAAGAVPTVTKYRLPSAVREGSHRDLLPGEIQPSCPLCPR